MFYYIYDSEENAIGYSTYPQFEGQEGFETIPQEIIDKQIANQAKEDLISIIRSTDAEILRYLEEIQAGYITTLTESQFLDMCYQRKQARDSLEA